MESWKKGLTGLLIITLAGCAYSPFGSADKADMVTIENYKYKNDDVTEVAQLMCFKRHIAPYQESARSLPPTKHKIYIRSVDYNNFGNDILISRGGGQMMSSTYLLLEAVLQPGQHVAIKRHDENDLTYLWLQDLDSGKPVSEVKATKMLSNFNVSERIYDKQCAKGTV
ncbi:hypothetical protein [Neptunicella sp. SCSIO 80796]|uniref:hypothetical protein n=1 Tax=Neptunicella plasticusilytica TaxID=3117012 RepID=UPI003A4D5175